MIGFAHGLPVVSTTGPATPADFKNGQNVVLVPPGDAGSLKTALSELIMSPSKRAAYVAASLEVAEKFSWARIADEFVHLMENLR
jgi:glycosyltransferase involved in cell wall biosynthesis